MQHGIAGAIAVQAQPLSAVNLSLAGLVLADVSKDLSMDIPRWGDLVQPIKVGTPCSSERATPNISISGITEETEYAFVGAGKISAIFFPTWVNAQRTRRLIGSIITATTSQRIADGLRESNSSEIGAYVNSLRPEYPRPKRCGDAVELARRIRRQQHPVIRPERVNLRPTRRVHSQCVSAAVVNHLRVPAHGIRVKNRTSTRRHSGKGILGAGDFVRRALLRPGRSKPISHIRYRGYR